jgi:hypothetical protein
MGGIPSRRTDAAETLEGARLAGRVLSLGPAMQFVLLLARLRAAPHQLAVMAYGHEVPDAAIHLPPVTLLWELVERYHPEQTWLAELWIRGERSLAEIEQTAPRGALAVGLIEAARRAETKGLWSSPLTTGGSPVGRSRGNAPPLRAGDAIGRLPRRVVLLGQVWGARSSLRDALLGEGR